jgi:hypothetical protein
MPRNQHTTDNVDNLDHEAQERISRLLDVQQDGLHVVLEEDAGDVALADDVGLLGDGVLVREEGVVVECRARVDAVDGWDDGEEVLELVKVVGCRFDGAVEGVSEGWVVVSKGEFVDDVGEIEC